MSSNNEMHVLEPAAEEVQIPTEPAAEFTEEELAQFYEENKDAIDLMGGLDIFESLMNVPDEQFKELEPAFLQVFQEVLEEKDAQAEMLAMMASPEFNADTIQSEFILINDAIDSLDFQFPVRF